MAIIDVAKNAATLIGIGAVTQVFGSTNTTMLQFQACINRSAETIRDEFDWQSLQKMETITGDGVEEDFALPVDYQRMLADADVWPTGSPNNPMTRILTSSQWLQASIQAFQNPYGEWCIFGDRMHLRPVVPVGETAKYMYVSNWIVRPTAGNNKPLFTADTDTFVLNERLLELCIVWNWKAGKNQAYSKELQDYETMLNRLIDKDRGAKPILSGGSEGRRAKLAWPWTVHEAS
ncbi:MAG: hypothetical protein R3D70_09345 [Rhizobiaceae bacterium]